MVSVDPERDSVKHLKEYTAFFHGEMIGVTGTTAEIASLAKAFGAGYIRQPAKADGSYAVDHTVSTYVVDADGNLAAVLDLGVTTDKLVATVRKLL
jgi:protein SCO1/2